MKKTSDQYDSVSVSDSCMMFFVFFFSSRRRHTRWTGDWSSDVCSSDLREAWKLLEANLEAVLERPDDVEARGAMQMGAFLAGDRKSTRLNSSHPSISYAVFSLKKKKTTQTYT